jgi:serine/threonine protein kinase
VCGVRVQGPQKRATLARIAVKAARGVEYLHGRSVVHFDLKADNLLCDLSSLDSPIVKIGAWLCCAP